MSLESTQEVMRRYWNDSHADMSMIADDVVFTVAGTGQEARGPKAIEEMIHYLYQVAFDAKAKPRNAIFADGHATLEADFVGKHIGEFAGIPATGKDVTVPMCIVYDLENDQIKRARIYFQIDALQRQLAE